MMYTKEIENFIKIINEVVELKKKKAKDYGSSWRMFGLDGIYVQIGSKFFRLWNLRNTNPKNEPIRDTLRDLVVYCIMAIQLIDENKTEAEIDKFVKGLKPSNKK